MSLFASLSEMSLKRPQVATIGVFDGVHLGHRYLIAQAVKAAAMRNAEVTVITFWPPPVLVLRPQIPPRCLMLAVEKQAVLAAIPGVAHIIVLPFTREFALQTSDVFLADLRSRMPLKALVEGDDFTLGHNREGTIQWLHDYGIRHAIDVIPIARQGTGDLPISSTRIRSLIEDGKIAAANTLLGRPYRLMGEVIHGDGRGRSLGYPTANLRIDPLKLIPANGIYAVRAWRGTTPEEVWLGAASIGVRPTFNGTDRLVEVYLLDVNPDLYGQDLQIEMVAWLRNEQRFANVAELVAQMAEDVAATRSIFGTETGAIYEPTS
jgi:riboflavin kinase/FMN adenylyltransferase